MRLIELKELKELQIEILNDIAHFCKENDIRYCLAYGTLLGAVRHKGYIPWDDDIDIHMPRPDYNRFIATYNNREGIYRVIDISNNNKYGLPFAKVHDTRTIVNETLYKQDDYGIYIDIFPIDGIKDKKEADRAIKLRRLLNAKKAVLGKGRNIAKNLGMAITKILLLPFSTKQIIEKINKTITKNNYEECENVCSMCSQTAYKEIFPRSLYNETVLLNFEGKEYYVPKDYDTYLKQNYGDYMQLPPKEKQISNHTAIVMWRE